MARSDCPRSGAKLAALALSTALLFAAATGGLTHGVLIDRESVSATLAGNVGAGNAPVSGPLGTGNSPASVENGANGHGDGPGGSGDGPNGAGNAPVGHGNGPAGAGNAPGSAGPSLVAGASPAEAPVVRPNPTERRRARGGSSGARGGSK
ncbi:hypothetical protein [Halosimplex pelagicum]|uniref:Uncharacterized protein n=1 Tax=Halosimplex pelagicum TaxID=869886 RepID=A0A7D5TAB7_9EURY|nr:hypothetical protein [Halosimplex pelagicum]QLH81249.1 hypothetical protein HZS54_06175 [Halosimplex pelagicum]